MRHHKRNGTMSVSAIVHALAKGFGCVFHISELKRAVWRIMPEANEATISTAVWNLVHKSKVLMSPRPYFYQLRKDDGA